MTRKKKIAFVVPSLHAGGAERVMSFVAKNLSEKDFDAHLWVSGYEKDTIYDVEGVKVKYFNKSRVLTSIPNLFFALLWHRPDVVMSSIAHVNTTMGLLSFFFPRIKFIGREANVLSVRGKYGTEKRAYNRLPLMDVGYKKLDIILCQSKDMYNDMKNNFNVPVHKLRLINNPISDGFEPKKNKKKKEVVKFITVASLKKQKGHERIISALSKLKFPFTYTMIGDGSERDALFNLIEELGLQKKVTHIPHTNEVSKFLEQSDFFLQGSHVEGFPNCVIESCAVGTPVIAINAPGGLDEIIEPEINGLVAENEEEYPKTIEKAVDMGEWDPKKINQSIMRKFNKKVIIGKYEDLFKELSL